MKKYWKKFEHCVGEKTFRWLQTKQLMQVGGRFQMLLCGFKKPIKLSHRNNFCHRLGGGADI
jgi:hypothetical protein